MSWVEHFEFHIFECLISTNALIITKTKRLLKKSNRKHSQSIWVYQFRSSMLDWPCYVWRYSELSMRSIWQWQSMNAFDLNSCYSANRMTNFFRMSFSLNYIVFFCCFNRIVKLVKKKLWIVTTVIMATNLAADSQVIYRSLHRVIIIWWMFGK